MVQNSLLDDDSLTKDPVTVVMTNLLTVIFLGLETFDLLTTCKAILVINVCDF